MPATMQFDAIQKPSRYFYGLKAIKEALEAVADLAVVLNVHADPLRAILEDKELWPVGVMRLAVVNRAVRAPLPNEQEIRAESSQQFKGSVSIQVMVRQEDASLALDDLDAAEVDVINAIRQLEVDTVQENWEVHVIRVVPLANRNLGAVAPYAASTVECSLWSHE